jgi:hypothetical protein
MKIKLKEKLLVDEYIDALTTIEKVLWQETMGVPPKYLENYNPSFLIESSFFFLYIIISFHISNGFACFFLCFVSIPASAFLISLYRNSKRDKLDFAREQTQYIITNKRIIFILYHNETISIQSILYENIKKVFSHKEAGNDANICIVTNEPADFQTFKYWSQKPHEKIVMVQVEDHKRALDLIQEHIF